ncbi:hypothetical protein [Streptomyces sp. NBC_00859]|uniref:hypothetical protein n=1 Tax=Streptomyces sp. NBC_00859 TaxID=2903682 RepID=UPI00386FFB8A|nr:hypothetical protein OG584_18590 [Streptomyces sp. NBC_00859]
MGRADERLQAGLSCWEEARNYVRTGRPVQAGLSYQRGVSHLLLYIQLMRWTSVGSAESIRAFHAVGTAAREAVPVIEGVRTPLHAMNHARVALVASHLADPACGDPELAGAALRGVPGAAAAFDLIGDGPLTAEVRIAGAAEARLTLARLMWRHPGVADRNRRGAWPVGSGAREGFLQFRRKYRRGVLPSCVGLDRDAEVRKLAHEGVLLYSALHDATSGHEAALRSALAARDEVRTPRPV